MSKRLIKTLCVLGLMFVSASVYSAQPRRAKKILDGECLITALMNSKTLPGLFRIDEGVFGEGSKGISPDVIRILKLGERAIPLLIRHLDDKRIFKNMVACCWIDNSNGRHPEGIGWRRSFLYSQKHYPSNQSDLRCSMPETRSAI